MAFLVRILTSTPLLYLVALLPSRIPVMGLFDSSWYYAHMMHASGVWSVRFLVLTIAASPVLMLIRRIGFGHPLGRWLMRQRRHFGLISFYYAALHLLHYVFETGSPALIWYDLFQLDYFTGWVGFVIFLALALTSNTYSTRTLGHRWKVLHNGIYLAAGAIFFHWYLFDFFANQIGLWLAVFCGAKGVQFVLRKSMAAKPSG